MKGRKGLLWALALVLVPQFPGDHPGGCQGAYSNYSRTSGFAAFRAQVLAAITGHDRRVLTVMQVKQAYYHVGQLLAALLPGSSRAVPFGYWAG